MTFTFNKTIIIIIAIAISIITAVTGYAIQIDSNTREKIDVNTLKITLIDKELAVLKEQVEQLSKDVQTLQRQSYNFPHPLDNSNSNFLK